MEGKERGTLEGKREKTELWNRVSPAMGGKRTVGELPHSGGGWVEAKGGEGAKLRLPAVLL